jgi:hypothetical protein
MLKSTKILMIAYFWLAGAPFSQTCMYTGHSTQTTASFYGHLRQLVIDDLDEDGTLMMSELGFVDFNYYSRSSHKYNRGHRVQGCWVLGGIERTKE